MFWSVLGLHCCTAFHQLRRGLLPIVGLLSIMGRGAAPHRGVLVRLLSITGWGRLLSIAGVLEGAALHCGVLGGLLPIAGGCSPLRGRGCSPSPAMLHRCPGLSCCRALALGRRLGSCDARGFVAPCHVGLPGPGIKPIPLRWQAGSQPLDHQGCPHDHF